MCSPSDNRTPFVEQEFCLRFSLHDIIDKPDQHGTEDLKFTLCWLSEKFDAYLKKVMSRKNFKMGVKIKSLKAICGWQKQHQSTLSFSLLSSVLIM